jgi:hypothetical protein
VSGCTSVIRTILTRSFSAAHTWDSDDDDDSVPEIDAEAYRRSAEFLFSSDADDERSMAAMRGALAAGKRVPSKEALASLETVKLEDLEENGRSKSLMSHISRKFLSLSTLISSILMFSSMYHLLQ